MKLSGEPLGLREFREKFKFKKINVGKFGVEREGFIVDGEGILVPDAVEVLKELDGGRFGSEFMACQIENQVGPVQLLGLKEEMIHNDNLLSEVLKKRGERILYEEVAPWEKVPLVVYPGKRYKDIWDKFSSNQREAISVICGIHIHIGMPDHEAALVAHNKLVDKFEDLLELGDGSRGRRIELYRKAILNSEPRKYKDWGEFYQDALDVGFVDDVGMNWRLIRINPIGTVEVRVFGLTTDYDEIVKWAEAVKKIVGDM